DEKVAGLLLVTVHGLPFTCFQFAARAIGSVAISTGFAAVVIESVTDPIEAATSSISIATN
nr:hypothetical protein [Acidobacteriota bacterium]